MPARRSSSRGCPATINPAGAGSFNHLVDRDKEISGRRQFELFRRAKIEDEVELRRFLDGKVAHLGAAQNAINVACCPAVSIRDVGTVGHEAAVVRELALRVDRREPRCRRKRNDGCATAPEQPAR